MALIASTSVPAGVPPANPFDMARLLTGLLSRAVGLGLGAALLAASVLSLR